MIDRRTSDNFASAANMIGYGAGMATCGLAAFVSGILSDPHLQGMVNLGFLFMGLGAAATALGGLLHAATKRNLKKERMK